MKPIRQFLTGSALLLAVWLAGSGRVWAQDPCFTINANPGQSFIDIESQAANIDFPNEGATLDLACNKVINGFTLKIAYLDGETEDYFENAAGNPLISASLTYNGNTNLMTYNFSEEEFSISNSPSLQFESGTYTFNISADCTGMPPTDCECSTQSYSFSIEKGITVNITPSTPPTLGCGANATKTLTGSPAPSGGNTAQWARYNLAMSKWDDIAGATSATYGADVAGLYRYQVKGGGCTGDATITVNPAPAAPSVSITPNNITVNECTTVLSAATITIAPVNQGSNPVYQWSTSGSGTILNNSGNAQYPTIGGAGVYTVIMTNQQTLCIASATLTVANSPNLATVSVTINKSKPQLGCSPTHNTMDLTAMPSISTGTSTYTYKWNTGPTVDKITVSNTNTYTVTVTAAVNNCQAVTSVTVESDLSKPTVTVVASPDAICQGGTSTLTATPSETVTYQWSGGGGTASTNTVTPANNGNNTYTVTVTAADNGCTGTGTGSVTRYALPNLSCTDATYTLNNGEQRDFSCNVTGGELQWTATAVNVSGIPASGSGNVQDQVFTLEKAQAPGLVQYTLYGSNGPCLADTVRIIVEVLPETDNGIFIPELITPNGDGTNDLWDIKVDNTVDNPEGYNIMLFNRYGAQIYTGALLAPFDGTGCPDGPYIWVLTSPTGEKSRGTVTIIRR
ncbi:MAG: gliding motility-associated C-terminal domain-containing protein [Saprospiraceae bacterium]|nr:gliding motility-associated C-terminal domain-containing protein [Saprospiraceae bacterium]